MLEKKADDVTLMDISPVSAIADFFLLGTVRTEAHAKAVREEVTEKLKDLGLKLRRREGSDDSGWVVLDWGDLIVHILGQDERSFYNLERLWADARIEKVDSDGLRPQ